MIIATKVIKENTIVFVSTAMLTFSELDVLESALNGKFSGVSLIK